METALITGGAGFIGSHLSERLLTDGWRVICLDNFDTFYNPQIKRHNISKALADRSFSIIEGDIRNRKFLEE
ncbi:MAG: GDP-mannose 4,6-dehydratase, partial [Nitrospira sp.]|nr:GDP-mannose 4,6-dehydratase [Nitrospira sp.]